MKKTTSRRWRTRRLAPGPIPARARTLRSQFGVESLEYRLMLHGDGAPEHDLTEHVHHELSIFIDGDKVPFPLGFGTDASENILANPHNHSGDERVHVHPLGVPLSEFATVGDFFDVWRTNAGVAGNNPDAIFNSQQILGNFADATHVIYMYVNGELNDDFDDYEMHEGDDIVIVYSTVADAGSPILNVDDAAVLGGAPLHVPLNGFDPEGDALTYTVKSVVTDTGLTGTVLEGNRSMRINVADFGSMTFELFEQRAPRVTDAIIGIAQDGTYDGVIFHRIIDNFVIQGGDPTGTGTGDPSIPDFDDQFHVDLQHTQTGILSMAKAGDDTNSSQFFITEGSARSLDFNHSVFGVLTEGEAVRQAISNVPVGASDRPLTDVVMESVDVFFDETNGVLMLKAPEGAAGTAEVTITVTDEQGKSTDATFTVTVSPDTSNGTPFLGELPAVIETVAGIPAEFTLTAMDVEGDPVTFNGSNASNVDLTGSSIDPVTGEVVIVTPQGFTGDFDIIVNVSASSGPVADEQRVTISVSSSVDPPDAPLSVDLLASSDTGTSDDDDLTRLSVLQIEVGGVTDGALVTIYSGNTPVGSATASGDSVTVSANVGSSNVTHSISASQTVSGAESDRSPALAVTVDTNADGFTTAAPVSPFNLGITYTYNVGHAEELVGQQNLAYSLPTAPADMTIDVNTGQIIWDGNDQTAGSHDVVVVATDRAGNEGTQAFTLSVNGPPVLDPIDDVTEDEGIEIEFTVTADDADPNETLSFEISGDSAVPTFNELTGLFNWTPGESDGGKSFNFTVTVRDSGGLLDQQSFTITVDEVNLPPSIAPIDGGTIAVGDTIERTAVGSDPDLPTQTLTYSLISPPTGASIDGDGGFTWTPTLAQADDDYTITVRVTDEGDLFAETSFTVTVQTSPEPPVFDEIVLPSVGEGNVDEGNFIDFTLTATDPNLPNDSLTFAIVSDPMGATLDKVSGSTALFRWQTNEMHGGGAFEFTVRVSDSSDPSKTDTVTVSITVNEVNQAPNFLTDFDDQNATEGENLHLDFGANDLDRPKQTLTFSLLDPLNDSPLDLEGADFNPVNGVLNWIPTVDQALQEIINIKVLVIDGEGGEDVQTVAVIIAEREKAPILDPIADQQVDEGDAVSFKAKATDSNEDDANLRFSLDQPPNGATIDPVSGEFVWQTSEADGPGGYDVTIVVTDSSGRTDQQSFVITVDEVDLAPVLDPIPDAEVTENRKLEFTATAADDDEPDQDLRFSLSAGAPTGAIIHPVTGDFEWTPPVGSAGNVEITVVVTDNGSSTLTDSQSFNVEVQPITNSLAFAQTLAIRTTQPQFVGPLPLPASPVILPAIVTQPRAVADFFGSPAQTFRDYANIGSGGGATATDDSSTADSDKSSEPVDPTVPSGKRPDDIRRRRGLDEEEQQDVEAEEDALTYHGRQGLSHEAVDQAIAALMAESAASH